MSLFSPYTLPRSVLGMMIAVALLCPSLWGKASSDPKVLTSLWQTHVSAQITGLDLSWDGQTVAFTAAPFAADENSHLHIYDLMGREVWTTSRRSKILGVSLSEDGQYAAIGSVDFSIAFFSKKGELLWERRGIGLPYLMPQETRVVAFNVGVSGLSNTLLEVFFPNGAKAWTLRRKGRVWRSIISDQGDLLLGLWNGEVVLIDRHRHIAWQQMLPKDIMALAISPKEAQYFAIGAGVLEQRLYLFERTGRLVWQRKLPLGITELSLARHGEFLLSYGNTIRGQHLALYRRNGDLQWAYHREEPAAESSKAIIVPDYPLVVAGIERDQHYYLQGFALTGQLLWTAPVPNPIVDFRVSRDGRYMAATTDSTLYFFDTRPVEVEGSKAELQK
jgi:outer membrane protein assembly factor BamB